MHEAIYRRPVQNWNEADALTDEHHYLVFRAGARRRAKQAYNRRTRRTERQVIWSVRD